MSSGGPARARSLPAWLLPVGALAAWTAAYVLAFHPPPGQRAVPAAYVLYGVPYVAFAAVGGLIVASNRASRVGWVMAAIGVLQGLATLSAESVRAVAAGSPTARGVAGWLMVVVSPLPVLSTSLIVVLLLVFPDGRLPSRRWRWLLGLVGVLVLAVQVQKLASVSLSPEIPGLPPNPIASPGLAAALARFTPFWTFPLAVLVAAWSMVGRYRSGTLVVRRQIKWFALSAVVLAACEAGNAALGDSVLAGVLDSAGKLAVVAAIGIAVLRHRLYDVDVAISRTLAYGWLAVVVTAIYVALVVGVGSELGHPSGPDLWLSLVATVVVALVSLPLRSRLQEFANRLVYGRRQAPYESLAGFTRRLADRYAIGDVLPGIAAALGEGLRARAATVQLRQDGVLAVVETWPAGSELPEAPPQDAVSISHQGNELGALAVWTEGPLTPAEHRLLSDLGTQAGLVVHNAALTAELRERLEELRASRLRLVTAQDAERRRLERDLHDGAQQDLVTLRMKLGAAEQLAGDADPRMSALLAEVREHTAATLESIRRLSRGLCPPLLQSHGLVAALVAHARRLPVPVEVHGAERRFTPEVETAVYFCCVEALQNVVKHSGATRSWVTVDACTESLRFEVGDDGVGFGGDGSRRGSGLQNMTDRLEALGGRLEVRWDQRGARVIGALPLRRPQPAATPAGSGAEEPPTTTSRAGLDGAVRVPPVGIEPTP